MRHPKLCSFILLAPPNACVSALRFATGGKQQKHKQLEIPERWKKTVPGCQLLRFELTGDGDMGCLHNEVVPAPVCTPSSPAVTNLQAMGCASLFSSPALVCVRTRAACVRACVHARACVCACVCVYVCVCVHASAGARVLTFGCTTEASVVIDRRGGAAQGPPPVWIPTRQGIAATNLANFMQSFEVGSPTHSIRNVLLTRPKNGKRKTDD